MTDEESTEIERGERREYERLGKMLIQGNCGGYVTVENRNVLFYTRIPESPRLATVSHGIVIPFDTEFLKRLCELCDQAAGFKSTWTSQTKGICRLQASCVYSGDFSRSRSTGIRVRNSKKCGCNAMVRASPLGLSKHKLVENLVKSEATRLARSRKDDCVVPDMWCIAHLCTMQHTKHELEKCLPEVLQISRSNDILLNDEICEAIDTFLRIRKPGRGIIEDAMRFLGDILPKYTFEYDAIRNAV